jgi:hypothetical protein
VWRATGKSVKRMDSGEEWRHATGEKVRRRKEGGDEGMAQAMERNGGAQGHMQKGRDGLGGRSEWMQGRTSRTGNLKNEVRCSARRSRLGITDYPLYASGSWPAAILTLHHGDSP